MKSFLAIAVAVVAVGFFAADANAQCYRGGGGFGYAPTYRSTTVFYGGAPGYRHPAHFGNTQIYRNVYSTYPYRGYGHPNFRPQYNPYGGYYNRGGVYYRGTGVGLNIRF